MTKTPPPWRRRQRQRRKGTPGSASSSVTWGGMYWWCARPLGRNHWILGPSLPSNTGSVRCRAAVAACATKMPRKTGARCSAPAVEFNSTRAGRAHHTTINQSSCCCSLRFLSVPVVVVVVVVVVVAAKHAPPVGRARNRVTRPRGSPCTLRVRLRAGEPAIAFSRHICCGDGACVRAHKKLERRL
ncbi:uncharacterized protein K452DRAFT_69268 [Aplosporella prunicola CBS 121167]|uniref:Uncharacterized protein n=1 Tax=Aplosporella prunicola CBS 121167 TaxID=1176127 RepID=A0A6A6BTH4_9PEZI|nr:uncharacterized protein K452DRAFT_69268 [Aplosporella prunicola CBS 121167]KAF2146683.1 hypothetical protein K452DRAFT_69268 [Aplosporella prunicola CBS 121167]